MPQPITIWTSAVQHPAFRCGGWGAVWMDGGPSGLAGGERKTTVERMALAGLAGALGRLPPGLAPVLVKTGDPELLAWAEMLANLSGAGSGTVAPPDQNLDLWARILSSARGRRVEVARTAAGPDTPLAFVAAWAELAMDRAKARGPFETSIPKANLAKVNWLA